MILKAIESLNFFRRYNIPYALAYNCQKEKPKLVAKQMGISEEDQIINCHVARLITKNIYNPFILDSNNPLNFP